MLGWRDHVFANNLKGCDLGLIFIVLIGFALLAVMPQMWVKSVIRRHGADRPDFPGTGGEFARHILDEMGLKTIGVEETDLGDHYDPEVGIVRLLPQHYNGRSLSAVVIAAHEVGHAMQDATGYRPLRARTKLAKQAVNVERIGSVVMLAAPLMMVIAKTPHLLIIELVAGMSILSMTILMHATTLPVEFDASFRRALPVLQAGGYIGDKDMSAARQILKAAAYTYVAAAALSMLNIMRWLRILRF